MNDSQTQNFARFSQEKLRPVIDSVTAGKRSSLLFSLLAAAGLFAIFLAAMYFFLSPYRKIMGESGIPHWPLLLLIPTAIAVVGFSIVYILCLRRVVGDFRTAVIARLAEFIDPGLVHEANRPIADTDLSDSLLFAAGEKVRSGPDYFRGRIGGAAVGIGDIVVERAAGQEREVWAGLFLSARFPQSFRSAALVFPSEPALKAEEAGAALAAPGEDGFQARIANEDLQIVEKIGSPPIEELVFSPAVRDELRRMRDRNGSQLRLSCRGDKLTLTLLAKEKAAGGESLFTNFDINAIHRFCSDAKVGLAVVREAEGNTALWIKNA